MSLLLDLRWKRLLTDNVDAVMLYPPVCDVLSLGQSGAVLRIACGKLPGGTVPLRVSLLLK